MTYSNEWTSSTMLMYKHSSSIKSAFVGFTKGERTDDCDKGSTSDDSIKSVFGESTDGEMINDCDKSSSFDDEVDVLFFLRGRSTISQSVGSVSTSPSLKS